MNFRYILNNMCTIHYSDPLFEELLSRVPKDQMRTSSLSFGIASRIIEIMERRGWLRPQMHTGWKSTI